jgi:hydroxypyruvate isomerase
MRIKQSVCYPMVKPPEMPLEAFVENVAEIGFPAVELWQRDADFEKLVALAKELGLVIASMIGHESLGSGLNDPAQHERIEKELRESTDIAAECEIPGLICFSGNRRAGIPEEESIERTAEGLRHVAPYAEERGINLNLELLNSRFDHPGYECDRTAWGIAVCERVSSPNVKLLYDIYHMQIMEGDVIRTIRNQIRWIGHFHTAGVPGRHEIDETQELNYGAVSRAIAETGYNLYLGHEFSPTGDVLEALRRAYGICDQA